MLKQTSRKTAFALTVVAAVSTPASLTSSLANAADANGFPACAKLTGTAKALCAANELGKRIAAEKKKEAAANREAAAARREAATARKQTEAARKRIEKNLSITDCANYLLGLIRDKIYTQRELLKKADGRFTDDNTCRIAKRLGFERKEVLARPDVR